MKKIWPFFGVVARAGLAAAVFVSLIVFPLESHAAPFPATACAATRFGSNLGCTANDVSLSSITIAAGSISSCVSGTPVTLDLDLTVNFATPDRWDVGIFIANDGKLPTLLPASGGASSCSVDILPITPPAFGYTFPDLDGVPNGTADTCGDGNSSINGGTGSGVKRMTGVTLPCYASPASGGKLFVPFVVSWDNQKSPFGNLCTSNLDAVPSETSKCNAPASSVSVDVVVLPVITKTNGGTIINPGADTTYTVVIDNNSGGTLLDSVFTDPAVTDLTVNSVSCAAANGASCPTTTVAAMQGAGITIPSASLPNDSSLTFSIEATLSSGATVGNHLINTASVTVGSNTTSATDDDLIVIAPTAAKSFAPSTIPEGAGSLLTVTLTNPTTSAVTGVSFTDTYPSGIVNTAAANGATTCGGTVTAANNGNSVALSGGTIPASGSCTVTVNVTSAVAGSYTNSTGTVTADSGAIPAASAPLTVTTPVFGTFNACDTAAAPNAACTNATTVTESHIKIKIAGSPFNLDLVALENDGSRKTSYNGTVRVELLDASDNSGALDADNCRSSWTTVIATLSPNPAFAPANNGLITVGPFTVSNAYREVRVRVTRVSGPSHRGCSTDNFAIRPNVFASFSVSDNGAWDTAGTTRALNDVTFGSVTHKAGRPASARASAVNAAGSPAVTTNYNGTPTATITACAGAACTAGFGTLTLDTTFAAGLLASDAASYDNVGSFGLELVDGTFAAVDSADGSTAAEREIRSGVIAVGRFVPDHFAVSYNTPAFGTVCASGNFTYIGQAFNYTTAPVITLQAENAANGPATLYTGSWWRTTNASLTGKTYAVATGTLDTSLIGSPDPVISDNGNGNGTLTFNSGSGIAFTRSTPVAPFDADIALSINVLDSDGVAFAFNPAAFGAATAGNGIAFSSGKEMRFGRLKLSNAYGSELLNLPVPIETQYYNGTAFITNAQDNCTTLAAGSVKLTTALTGVTATVGGAFAGGKGSLTLSKPSPAAQGTVDICVDLDAGAGGDTSCQAGTPADKTYLQGKWSGASYDKDPAVRGTFGLYKSPNEIIFIRENY